MWIKNVLKKVYKHWVPDELAVFPEIDVDLEPHRLILKGRVLNAGAGLRDVFHLIEGELINQDLTWPGDTRTNIDIRSPLHQIPTESNHFDAILCIAVMEHVENPEEVVPELYRVLKPGGHLILEVPFLQPEHKVPTDFQRYTKDGLVRLVSNHGFRVLGIKGIFTVYHTLYWQIHIWLHLKKNFIYLLLRILLLRPLLWRARKSRTYSDRLATGFQLIATK
ncbi:MAG: methyltransferase domain-containing protein [Acidobacteria bacterium]|jgi:SAM-dependent methyltransferase|nr:methyltransferase domain-containing protein [Acidobacteriota bacterium]